MTDYVLFQQDAETAVLGIVLQNPSAIYDLQKLKSYMFSSQPNQVLFSTMLDLASNGSVPDLRLLEDFMKARNSDALIGGKEYLNYLMKQQYNFQNLKEFERIIVDSFKARSLIKLATECPDTVKSTTDINDTISNFRNALDKLSSDTGGETTANIDDILKETWKGIEFRVQNPGIRGISTGLRNVDIVTSGFNSGDVIIIAGRPGMGKSAMLCNLVYNQGKVGIPTLTFSYEMPKTTLVERILSIDSGVNTSDIRLGMMNQDQVNLITESAKRIKSLPIYIDSNYSANISYVVQTIRKYKKLHNIKIVYLDYVQLMAERSMDATNELGRISRALKILANELGITVVILSQLSRGVESRDNKRPLLSDLRQSGNLEEDADIVIFLYREVLYNSNCKYKDLMECIVEKQRNGPRGTILLSFEEQTNRITEKQ